jgi:hypothetical protein
VGGQELVLNGAGLRSLFGFRVYVAALYLARPGHETAQVLDQDVPRRMLLTMLRDTSTARDLDVLKGGLAANNTAEEITAIQGQVDHFLGLIRQVQEIPAGTAILLDYLPGVGTRVRIGGRELGTIQGERFNRAILRIWLGNDPIQLSLKKALLGLAS